MISRISLKHSARVNIGTDRIQVSDDANAAAAVVDNINLFLSLETCYWHFKMSFVLQQAFSSCYTHYTKQQSLFIFQNETGMNGVPFF